MLVLDTNHLRELTTVTPTGVLMRERMNSTSEVVVTTVVSMEESLRGWLARVASARSGDLLAHAYHQLDDLIHNVGVLVRLPWDLDADQRFQSLRKEGIRIGTLDLRIACICLEHDATLLTRNLCDFSKIPDLKCENWLD